ncbi:hypothetical protein TNCV_4353901 [Trichonephila clavipes]|nr:hypothetical protein TNCV_4353901 [Trichonephila clavipes]
MGFVTEDLRPQSGQFHIYRARHCPNRTGRSTDCKRLHPQLSENGSFTASTDGRWRSRTAPEKNSENVTLDHVDETPGTSTRAVGVVYMSINEPFGEFYR